MAVATMQAAMSQLAALEAAALVVLVIPRMWVELQEPQIQEEEAAALLVMAALTQAATAALA